MDTFKIYQGTSFCIDSEADKTLGQLPVALSEDLEIPLDCVYFTKCSCGSCNNDVAIVSTSEVSHLIFDPEDLVKIAA